MSSDLTILLPAYNEEDALGQLLDEIEEEVAIPHKVLVVDNNSTDGTSKIALEKGTALEFERRKGKGNAVRFSIETIDTPYTIMMNADRTYSPGFVPLIYFLLRGKTDVVMGYRSIVDEGAMPAIHALGNWGLSLLASTLYGKRVYDVCTGMWGFKTDRLKEFNLSSEGFTLEADLFVNSRRTGCRIAQVPIGYRKRMDGSEAKLQILDGLKIGSFLVKSKWQK